MAAPSPRINRVRRSATAWSLPTTGWRGIGGTPTGATKPTGSSTLSLKCWTTRPLRRASLAWVVAEEGKGLDFVLEVLHKGDRNKDLVENVERYAQLGIPEY